jgi:hypothetical protein
VGYFRALLDSRITHDRQIGSAPADLGAGDLVRQSQFSQKRLDDDLFAKFEPAGAAGVAIEPGVRKKLPRIGRRHGRGAGVIDERVS